MMLLGCMVLKVKLIESDKKLRMHPVMILLRGARGRRALLQTLLSARPESPREREREGGRLCVCVCMCVQRLSVPNALQLRKERERARQTDGAITSQR